MPSSATPTTRTTQPSCVAAAAGPPGLAPPGTPRPAPRRSADPQSPQGKLHQVEYALEAVKQGSAAIGLRSKTHAVLLTLKRSTGELATYQKKLIRIDDHVGIAIAGLTSDARVLSNSMRQQAMQSRMLYGRPIPVARIVQTIADSG